MFRRFGEERGKALPLRKRAARATSVASRDAKYSLTISTRLAWLSVFSAAAQIEDSRDIELEARGLLLVAEVSSLAALG